jgi:hypothetical protein
LGDGALSSIVSEKNFFQAYVMSKPKIGLAIAWALNLDIHSFFLDRGYLNKMLIKKLFSIKTLSNFGDLTAIAKC